MRELEAYGVKLDLLDLSALKELRSEVDAFEKRYSEPSIREQAQTDAQLGIPMYEAAQVTPFEMELAHAAARLASRVATAYKGPLEVLDAGIRAEYECLEGKRRAQLERVETVYQAEKEAAENAFALKDAHSELERIEKRYLTVYERYGRDPISYLPAWFYLVIACLIFVGEIPLNAMAFQIFAESQVMTIVMAFVVGLCVPLSAHFIGIKFREHPDGFSVPNAAKGLAGSAVVVTALYWLSIIRQTYLDANRETLGLNDALVHSSFMFFWLNVAVFVAAVMVSYLAHDSVPGYHHLRASLERARARVTELERERVARLKAAALERAEGIQIAHDEFRQNRNRVSLMKGSYDQLLKEGQEYESRCLDQLRQLVAMYRHENLRRRDDKRIPPSFERELFFELELVKMREKLNNDESETQIPL